jgi:SAM-dependent methyltransferase
MSDQQNIPAYRCLSCGSAEKYENRAFGSLPRVTSDSVPFTAGGRISVCLQCGLIQKFADEKWLSEIAAIYNNYKMYELTGGVDQPLFAEGGLTRADRLVEILLAHVSPSFAGDMLDIGCGTGGFLKAFGNAYPQVSLYGQEIDGRNLPYLKRIANFKTLFTADASPQGFTFDIIASIHCFEHIYDYAAFFSEIEALRKESGLILLQMPDIESSPFDIVIADHVAHFSQDTLQRCLNRHRPGFSVGKPYA